jgi:hypothetical protein
MNNSKNNFKYNSCTVGGKKYQKSTGVKANAVTNNYVDSMSLKTDPFGSWTGKPDSDGVKPVQDVDDL